MQAKGFNIALSTAVERRRRALFRGAPPPPFARVSVANTAVVQVNVGLQNAHPNQSAGSSFASSMVGLASAHIHQDAARLPSSLVATVASILTSRNIEIYLLYIASSCLINHGFPVALEL